MKFDTFGNKNNPIIVMLTGSFSPGESMKNVYSKMYDEYYIIVPTYNGHYENSKDFTTRQEEAREIYQYIKDNKIGKIKMIYGQSMGGVIGMELLSQLMKNGIQVEKAFFDGGPFIKLSKAYKIFMYFKFKTMINMFKNKTIDEAMNWKFLKQFAGNKIEALRPMIESLIHITPYLTNNSIKNEVECCYTFDFPKIDENMQKNLFFFYGEDEKAYKTCFKYTKNAYPYSNYRVESGHGHITFACENTEEYIKLLKGLCL